MPIVADRDHAGFIPRDGGRRTPIPRARMLPRLRASARADAPVLDALESASANDSLRGADVPEGTVARIVHAGLSYPGIFSVRHFGRTGTGVYGDVR
jgi:hypothetical protein